MNNYQIQLSNRKFMTSVKEVKYFRWKHDFKLTFKATIKIRGVHLKGYAILGLQLKFLAEIMQP